MIDIPTQAQILEILENKIIGDGQGYPSQDERVHAAEKIIAITSTQVGEQMAHQYVRDELGKVEAATVERCAQVVLNAEVTDERHGIKLRQQLAAAIRALANRISK